ncbi:MAG: response regulator [Geobacteraceae bacterium]|nr:response regulator [Geobacteraceae bacterium]
MTFQTLHNGADSPHKPSSTILIVDDESSIRDLCAKTLKGYRVFQAGTCHDALRVYKQERIDLVLTDVMMPGGSGLDLLRQIKEFDPNATVIIMTGFSEKDVILGALKDGADDFISKPLNMLQLKTAVEKSLIRKSLKEELASLKNLDHLKGTFLSLISHKLRTPITTISLFLQNIERGVYETNDASFLENVKLINDEAIYLGRMVTDLLTFSQVMEGSERLNREACDLNLITASAVYASQESQRKPGIETDFQEIVLPAMNLDRAKITFALQQIIDNAYKFSSELGTVSISLFNGGDHVCVVVSDSGVGIPPEEIPKVFEKFYQIDPHNTGQVRGFGLGLFYAREFIHQHGGTISMDSEPGLGTTVTVSLPMQ